MVIAVTKCATRYHENKGIVHASRMVTKKAADGERMDEQACVNDEIMFKRHLQQD